MVQVLCDVIAANLTVLSVMSPITTGGELNLPIPKVNCVFFEIPINNA